MNIFKTQTHPGLLHILKMSYQVHNSRRIPQRKRKERENDDGPSELGFRPSAAATVVKPPSWRTTQPAVSSSNRLLAGYMAYEFITRGTLLGQDWCSAEPVKEREREAGAVQDSYAEVASILKTEGAHIPGIVNPTQLARWIQM